jgi:hypothetical protein
MDKPHKKLDVWQKSVDSCRLGYLPDEVYHSLDTELAQIDRTLNCLRESLLEKQRGRTT